MSRPAVLATTGEETPVFFRVGEEEVFGIFTQPTVEAVGTAVIVLPGPGIASMVNRNRVAVRLCRRLAAMGYHTMRIDYQGTGESTGMGRAALLERPFTDDLEGAIRWLEERGLSRFVLAGTCYGAWTALMGAWKLPQVHGALLISIPSFVEDESATRPIMDRRMIRRRVRGLFHRRLRHRYVSLAKARLRALFSRVRGGLSSTAGEQRWVRSELFESLDALIRRDVPLLLAFGTEDKAYAAFRWASPGRLGQILQRHEDLIEVEAFPGVLHGLPTLTVQGWVLDLATDWVQRHSTRFGAAERP